MASIVEKSINVNEDNAKELCWAESLELEGGSYAFVLYLDGSTDGWAHLNDAAKAELYPTETARPFKLDSTIVGSRSAGTMYVMLEFDGTAVYEVKITSISKQEHSQSDITHDLISSSTRTTDIAWQVDGSSTVSSFRVDSTTIKMYFYQYEMNIQKGKNAKGVESVHVSNINPYHGDMVTVSANLVEGAKWYGWYSDPEHTNLIAADQTVTFEAGSDITAYAYATLGTGLFIKKNDKWANSINIYNKVNGVWEIIEKNDVDLTKRYNTSV